MQCEQEAYHVPTVSLGLPNIESESGFDSTDVVVGDGSSPYGKCYALVLSTPFKLITYQRQVQDRPSTDINNELHLLLYSYLWHTNHSPQHWLGHPLVLTSNTLTLMSCFLTAVDASMPGWRHIVHSAFFFPTAVTGGIYDMTNNHVAFSKMHSFYTGPMVSIVGQGFNCWKSLP